MSKKIKIIKQFRESSLIYYFKLYNFILHNNKNQF